MTNIALIPARAGSKRVPKKNIRELHGHPLLAYTIAAALDSGCFHKVLVSSDDTTTLEIAARYGADCLRRPDDMATDTSPDIEWVTHALTGVMGQMSGQMERLSEHVVRYPYDTFAILRPTSPFRKPETIRRAFHKWNTMKDRADSLRAVTPCGEHAAKQWRLVGDIMVPLLLQPESQPWHSSQKTTLPQLYTQTAGLEIAHVRTVQETGTIAGNMIAPFILEGPEAFDLNVESDWTLAELMVKENPDLLPVVRGADVASL